MMEIGDGERQKRRGKMAESDFQKAESQLQIDAEYYNTLDIGGFSRMLKDPSYCYKFYWLEAIVKLISEDRQEVSYDEMINEMISNAWYSVLEFHVHLSGIWGDGEIKDSLEKAVLKLYKLSGLPANASKVEIKNKIEEFDKELHEEKMVLTKNVPYKALSGFANRSSECIDLNSSAGRMIAYYNRLNNRGTLLPYTFDSQKGLERKIIFQEAWIQMIQDQMTAILGWIQYEKVRWLQNNNPEVPGLVYKLMPLDDKMRKLAHVRRLWEGILDTTSITDVFKHEPIKKESYDVDHFIPWSFVMNDELWNLMPMDSSLNSSKSNRLPQWDRFFARFAENQYIMYELFTEKRDKKANMKPVTADNLLYLGQPGIILEREYERRAFQHIREKYAPGL